MTEVEELVEAKADIIAIDATGSIRPNNVHLNEFFSEIKHKYPTVLLMADCSSYEEAIHAR